MIHLPDLIQDLALILMAAAVMTLLFRRLNQPAVLGYVIAGLLVGPHFEWLPSIVDTKSVQVWAEIGVIFLLFALGLEFSFKKLARVGGPATITAVVEVVGMVLIGYGIGKIFGWTNMDSLFLGGILGISSTTIIIRAFEELGVKTRGFARLVFGVLIVEDLVAILLMVLLSTVAVSRTFSGTEMLVSTLKLGFFLCLWIVLGLFIIPIFLKRARPLLGSETLLIVSAGLCFLMVVLATKAGFSPALGAFIMGSILAETVEGHRIEHLIGPVKDLFAAVFFVSVGMLIDPKVLVEYAGPILVLTVATIFGKFITTAGGALISGQSLKRSVQAGMSLAQIGEFSFIIAGLGLSLKVTSDFLYPVAIGVSVATTFTTPYMIRHADKAVELIETRFPARWLKWLETFRVDETSSSTYGSWRPWLKRLGIRIGVNTVVVIAIILLLAPRVLIWLTDYLGDSQLARLVSLALTAMISAPFLWALAVAQVDRAANPEIWSRSQARRFVLVIEAARALIAVSLLTWLATRFIETGIVIATVIFATAALALTLSTQLGRIYHWIERRFLRNLSERERASTTGRELSALAPWDSHLVELTMTSDSPLAGKKLSDSQIRERFGVTIALIERGSKIIPAPGRNEILYPGDRLQVIGTDEQIGQFKSECEFHESRTDGLAELNYELRPVVVESAMSYSGKTIRECGLREATRGLVVGIEKKGVRTLNPDSSTVIEPGDILWLVGDREKLGTVGRSSTLS